MNTEASERETTVSQCEGEPNRSFRVLVIDDSEVDREILAERLGRAWPFKRELELHFSANGWEALEKMRRIYFHMIFVDWLMPVFGGCQVLRALRKNGVHIPVVVVSGLQREEIGHSLESVGAAFLNKDEMTETGVRQAIDTALQWWAMARSRGGSPVQCRQAQGARGRTCVDGSSLCLATV